MSLTRTVSARRVNYPIGRSALEVVCPCTITVQRTLSRGSLSSKMGDMIKLLFSGEWAVLFRRSVNQDGRFGETTRGDGN